MPAARPISLPELDLLLDQLRNPRDRAFVLLAANTGARVAELTRATWAQVMTPRATFTGSLALPRRHTKRRRPARSVPLAGRTLQTLADWYVKHPAPNLSAPLFPTPGRPETPLTPRQIQRILRAAATAAGLAGPISPHSLRKFYGSHVYAASGNDIALAAHALGHANAASTPRYLGVSDARRDAALSTLFSPPELPYTELPPAPGAQDAA